LISGNPSADADGDGLTNLYESAIGSDPLNPSTAGDTIPDGWALFFGLNPTDPSGGGKIAPDGLTYLQAFQKGLNPSFPNLAPPAVSTTFPADNASNYPTNGVVVVRFNEPLQAPATIAQAQTAIVNGLPANSTFSSANAATAAQVLLAYLLRTCCGGTAATAGTLQLMQGNSPVPGTVALSNDGLSLVFTPRQPLSASTTYTVLVQGAKAVSGVPMTSTFQSTFTTGLTASSTTGSELLTSPPNGATNVPTNAAFMVQFSEQVNPASLTPQTFFLTDSQSGQIIQGMLQVDPSGFTAAFVPQTQYPVGRTIEVSLSGITDITQNPFPAASFVFTTGFAPETQGPALLGVSPSNGVSGVPLNAPIVAQFNEPLSVISATMGLQLQQNGNPVPGAIALANGNTLVTFTPVAPLTPSTAYTIAVTSQITDVSENVLTNPGNFSFTTGTTVDVTPPTVVGTSPVSGQTNVGLNALIEVQFSEPIDPLSISVGNFFLYEAITGHAVPVTFVVAADRMSVTFMPTTTLLPDTIYNFQFSGYTDIAGNAGSGTSTQFTTGVAVDTTHPVVSSISPVNGASGVAVNAQVMAVFSEPINPLTIVPGTVQIIPAGGSAVGGMVTLASDHMSLTFVPSAPLNVSTSYTIQISGLNDAEGNTITTFTSSFQTGASAVPDTTAPTVTGISPANGTTGVAVNSKVVITLSKPIVASEVNVQSVPVFLAQSASNVAGTYSVSADGMTITFTPQTPYPGNALMQVDVNSTGTITDVSGNVLGFTESQFTTANTADTTAPVVTSVTPTNGATGIGTGAAVVLTFSKSLNPVTVNQGNTVVLFNGDTLLTGGAQISSDNRTVTINAGVLPASSTITVVATHDVTDLSGNHLTDFRSQFTTAAATPNAAPLIVTQRPGTGATGVPQNAVITLFVNASLNTATVPGAVHVSQNGVLITGTVNVTGNGTAIEFTPSEPFDFGALVQIFVDPTVTDTFGNTMNAYSGQFTITADPATTTPAVIASSPTGTAPLNAVADIEFNVPLDATTVNATNVQLTNNSVGGAPIPSTVTLRTPNTIRVVPTTPLAPNTTYIIFVSNGLHSAGGIPVSSFQEAGVITTGTVTDTTAPTVIAVAPPNGQTKVGTNALLVVTFSEPVDPITVDGTTVKLSAGTTTEMPASIQFDSTGTMVTITPLAPLPDSTVMTIAISGVQDLAGNAVTPKTTTFTTGVGADTTAPTVTSTTPPDGATNVPTNAVITVQFSEPMNAQILSSPNVITLTDNSTGLNVNLALTVSSDGLSVALSPSSDLSPSEIYTIRGSNAQDLAGNPVYFATTFTTGGGPDNAPPQVLLTNPSNASTAVPTNTVVEILFNKAVSPISLLNVSIAQGGQSIAVVKSLANANQTVLLTPVTPLAPTTSYSVSISGVESLADVQMTGASSVSFTTGLSPDLLAPAVTNITPADGSTNISVTTVIQIKFSEAMDPLGFSIPGSVLLTTGGQNVSGTVSLSADGTLAMFQPTAPLSSGTSYTVSLSTDLHDVAGNQLPTTISNFVTQ
jgi:hypothetical protein